MAFQAQSLSSSNASQNNSGENSSEAEEQVTDVQTPVGSETPAGDSKNPTLLHRFRHHASILCLLTSNEYIFAGTQAGEIIVFTLGTYQRNRVIQAHYGSVLGLCLSDDGSLLFSSAGDRLVNVWNTKTFEIAASIYTLYDVGDIFCVSFSSSLCTVYMGCQNTSLHWYDLTAFDSQPSCDPQSHPSLRQDRFLDSPGPGGIRNPQQRASSRGRVRPGTRLLQVPKSQTHQFAHYGYIQAMLLTTALSTDLVDGEALVTGGGDGIICIWSLDRSTRGRPRLVTRLDDGREDAESVLAVVIGGQFLFSGRVNGEINIWDLETRQLLRVLKSFEEDVLSLSVDSRSLFSVSDNGYIKVFNPQYECTKAWRGHQGKILASVCSQYKAQNLLITGGNDDSVAIWQTGRAKSANVHPRQGQEDEMLESLRTFVSFRTVSSDPRYEADCHRGASYLRAIFRKFGATTEMIHTEERCNPIVFARFGSSQSSYIHKKRILFYGHYDVVAAEDKQGKWMQDPFALTGQDGFLYGRGASDNKGPIMAAIYAVADVAKAEQLESEIIFLVEGEEERGSRCFEKAVKTHKHVIGEVDYILVANSYWLNDDVPCLTFGLRGVLHATIQVEGPNPDLHSGVDGSRWLDEPLKDLVMLTSKLNGPNGAIAIPGFQDAILPVSDHERRLYNEVACSVTNANPSLGPSNWVAKYFVSRWREPSLTVHGFKTSGSEKSTIIPHYASVAISMRLVPNQESCDVARLLEEFLHNEFKHLNSKNSLSLQIHQTAEPWLGDPSNKLFRTLERAVKDVWSRKDKRRYSSKSKPLWPPENPSLSRQRTSRGSNSRPTTPITSSVLASANSLPDDEQESAIDSSSEGPSRIQYDAMRHSDSITDSPHWRPLYICEGGSIPAIRFLEKEFSAPAAQLPCGRASDNAHLENERFNVLNLLNSREIFRRIFVELPKS